MKVWISYSFPALRFPYELHDLLKQLKAARDAKGLSLANLTELTGMDRSALSKLETGRRANPTVETLVRYAEAVGKRLVVSLTDPGPTGRSRRRAPSDRVLPCWTLSNQSNLPMVSVAASKIASTTASPC